MAELNAIKENREKQQKLHEAQMERMERSHAEDQDRYVETINQLVSQQQFAAWGLPGLIVKGVGSVINSVVGLFRR